MAAVEHGVAEARAVEEVLARRPVRHLAPVFPGPHLGPARRIWEALVRVGAAQTSVSLPLDLI